MDVNRSLAAIPSEPGEISKRSLTPSQSVLAVQIELCRQNSRCEVEPGIVRELVREFGAVEPEVLSEAFRACRNSSDFFPTIKQLWREVWQARERLATETEAERWRQSRAEAARARAAGEVIEFASLMDLCLQVAAETQIAAPSALDLCKPMPDEWSPLPPVLELERRAAEQQSRLKEWLTRRGQTTSQEVEQHAHISG